MPAGKASRKDPIFAAIAHRKATAAAHAGAIEAEPEDDAVIDALCAADVAAIRAMMTTPPTTLDGVKALLGYVAGCEEAGDRILCGIVDETAGNGFLRTLLAALESL